MTVSSQTNNATFVGNGVATAFPLPFRFFKNGDIRAYFIDSVTGAATQMVLGTDYTLIGAGEPEVDGNALSLLTTTVPLASMRGLYVERVMPQVQETDIVNQGQFFASTHEDVFDRLTMLIQQANANSAGAIRVAIGDPEPTRLVPAVSRANMLLGFDSSGNPIAVAPVSGSAADLAMNLANDTDPAKGAGLVGYKGRTVREALDRLQGIAQYTPEQFGAVGDGLGDDTVAMQAAADAAAANSGVFAGVPGSTYLFSTVRVKNGTRGVMFRQSVLLPDSSTSGVTTGALQLDGDGRFLTGVDVVDCVVSVEMDMQNGGRVAIFADGCRECVFTNNKIYGFTNHATINHYGLLFWFASNRNICWANNITGVTDPTMRGLLIDFIGSSDPFAGYFALSGATVRATVPCSDNIIANNTLRQGSYGVNLLGCERTVVVGNILTNQNHRSIYLAEACAWSLIALNECIDFLSTAVLLGYGCIENVVSNNVCKREPGIQAAGTGEAAINITTGARRNKIQGNKIYADTNYGIYMACDMRFNEVTGNEVRGYYLAGIALETDWEASADKPAGALYSRPNYQTPGSVAPGATSWSFSNADANVISGNTIREGAPGRSVAAIYVAQVNSNTNLSATRNDICNNVIYGDSDMAYYLYIFEETSGRSANNKLFGNRFYDTSGPGVTSKVFFSRGRLHFSLMRENDFIDTVPFSFAAADASPSVAYGGRFQTANTGATSITNFDDGVDEQVIEVRLDSFTTLVHNNSLIRLKGAVNAVGASTNNIMTFRRMSSVWFELGRNF